MPTPPIAFLRGAALRINRPNRADHGKLARFIGYSQDAGFAWIAFHKESHAKLPDLNSIDNPSKVTRKLYLLSHLLPHAE